MCKLFSETVEPYTGVYGELPGPITGRAASVLPVITAEMVKEITKEATADLRNFNFVFNLYQGGDRMDDFIVQRVKPYLRDGDVLNIVTGNGISPGADLSKANHTVNLNHTRDVNMDEVNTRLARFRRDLPGIKIH
jgi:hypothetical protein